MPKAIAIVFIFESDSSPGKTYQTLLYCDGSTSCECKGWVFKRRTMPEGSRTCKHTRYVEAGMGEEHAVKVVRYAEVVAAPRRPLPRVAVPGLAMSKGQLSAQAAGRRRVFDFEMED